MKNWWNGTDRGTPNNLGANNSCATSYTTNPRLASVRLNLGLRVEKPATNRLSPGTALRTTYPILMEYYIKCSTSLPITTKRTVRR